jgi:hypothetical protein
MYRSRLKPDDADWIGLTEGTRWQTHRATLEAIGGNQPPILNVS